MAEATEELREKISPNGSDGGSALSGLASKNKLVPVLATAAAATAAGIAVQKGPDLLKKLSGEADEEAEELGEKSAQGMKKGLASRGGLMGKTASKLMGGKTGGGGKKTRRLPIQRWTDVAVPVEKAYAAWTQFEEFPKFMHRVLEVKQEDDNKIHWQEKIWFSSRGWDGEITDKRKNDRIAWKTVSGTQHSGVISFHKLDANLTRVLVTVDFVPSGMIEKMASGMRFAKRAVAADLARFKAYVELGDIKGLEYKAKPAEMEQHRDGDDEEEEGEGDRQEAESRSGESSSEDRDRDSEREERENRRQERRKALSSSS
jgi:Polyketide cyclase / dehydrase and lipid transport